MTVELALGLARFETDSAKAATAAYKLGERIGDGLKVGAQGVVALSGAMATAAAGALAWADRSIKATAELHGLAEQTGVAASAIASFKTASDTSGVSLDIVARIIERLNVTLSKPISETKGAGAALKAIGINVEHLRALKPDEQLELIAQKLSGFAEGAGRGAVAVTLLGKSGAAALPFLNDLAESGRSQIKLTDEQIAQADQYAKAQARSRSELEQYAQAAALQATPAMLAFTEALRDTASEVVGVDTATKTLGKSTAVADFSESAVKSLGFVVDAGDGVVRVFTLAGKRIGAAAAVVAAVATGDLKAAGAVIRAHLEDADELLNAPLFSDRLAARLAQSKLPKPAEAARPQLTFRIPSPAKATAGVKESTAAYDSLIRSITEKTSVAEAELAGTDKLAESQRFALDVVTKLSSAEGKYSEAQKIAATAALEAYLPAAQAVELREKQAKAAEQYAKVQAEATAHLDRETQARILANAATFDALDAYGKTGAQIEDLRIARLQHQIALEEEALAVGRARDLSDAEAAAMERNIDLLRQQIAARRDLAAKVNADATDPLIGAQRGVEDYLSVVKDAGTATRRAVSSGLATLEDDLTRSFTTGKFSVKSFADFVVAEITRIAVVRPLLQGLFGFASGFVGGFANAFAGGGGASAIVGNDIALGFHSGGIVGQAGAPRAASASMFAGARRFHGGGIPGLGPHEVPAILMGGPRGRREEVIRADDPRHSDNGGGRSQSFNLTVNTQAAPGMSRDSALQIGSDIGRQIQRALRRAT